jgi:hypothetical protein
MPFILFGNGITIKGIFYTQERVGKDGGRILFLNSEYEE